MSYHNIFIVDDNETTLFVNQDVVEEVLPGATITSFSNSEKFLEFMLNNKDLLTSETLVLLDLNMPGMFGYEVLEAIEEETDELDRVHVIILTSSNLKRDLERSARFHCIRGYMEKPISPEKLKEHLGSIGQE